MTEQKIIRFTDTEMRASGDKDMTVEGYALKFDKETVIGSNKYGWREKIAKTALDGAKLNNVVLNFNHSMSDLLAGVKNKSLTLTVDETGLKITAAIIDTSLGRDVYKLIKGGLINRMSFAATIGESDWTYADWDSDELDSRVILRLDTLYDVSAVTFPAYEDTEISARGLSADFKADLKAEMDLRRKQVYERQMERLNKLLA